MSGEFTNVPSNASFFERASNPENTSIDIITTAEDQIRRALKNKFEPDSLSKQIKFYAVCLKKLDNTKSEHANLVRIKARIPELHYMLPIPKDKNDMAAIALYPTFVAYANNFNPKIGARTKIVPGTILTVTFGSMSNFSEPLLLEIGKILETESSSSSGGGSTGGRGGPVVVDSSDITEDDSEKSFKKSDAAFIRAASKRTRVDPRALAAIARVETARFGTTEIKPTSPEWTKLVDSFKKHAPNTALTYRVKTKRKNPTTGKRIYEVRNAMDNLKAAGKLTKVKPNKNARPISETNARSRAVNGRYLPRYVAKNYDDETLKKMKKITVNGKILTKGTFFTDHFNDSIEDIKGQKEAHKTGDSFSNLFGHKRPGKSPLEKGYAMAPKSLIAVTAWGAFQCLGSQSFFLMHGINPNEKAESIEIYDKILAQFYKDPFAQSILLLEQWLTQKSKGPMRTILNRGFAKSKSNRHVADLYNGIKLFYGSGSDTFNYAYLALQYGNIFEDDWPGIVKECGFKIN